MNPKAALLTINLETQELICTMFHGDNPCKDAWDLWEGIRHDWPDHITTVVADDDACEAFRASRTETPPHTATPTTPRKPEP